MTRLRAWLLFAFDVTMMALSVSWVAIGRSVESLLSLLLWHHWRGALAFGPRTTWPWNIAPEGARAEELLLGNCWTCGKRLPRDVGVCDDCATERRP